MTDLTTLADRVEAGTVEMQRQLLSDAMDAIHPRPHHDMAQKHPFGVMLAIGAYVDAAMMLVPEGYDAAVSREQGRGVACIYAPNAEACGAAIDYNAATPALALTAAALRSHASSLGE